jgi:DNA-binding XRE family transcriptional regulator
MTVQYIEISGKEMAVMPKDEYLKLAELAEDLDDIAAAIRAEKRAAEGEEYVPHELVVRLVNGESGLLVWREYRGLSQQVLGDKVGLSKMTISGLEKGKRDTSSKNWRALATALEVDVDDILPDSQ